MLGQGRLMVRDSGCLLELGPFVPTLSLDKLSRSDSCDSRTHGGYDLQLEPAWPQVEGNGKPLS